MVFHSIQITQIGPIAYRHFKFVQVCVVLFILYGEPTGLKGESHYVFC